MANEDVAQATVRVEFEGKTFVGRGEGGSPGAAITAATADAMTLVKRVFPKKKRLPRRASDDRSQLA